MKKVFFKNQLKTKQAENHPLTPQQKLKKKGVGRNTQPEDQLTQVAYWWKKFLLGLFFCAIIIVFLITLWISVTPPSWHWLTHDQVTQMREFFVDGAIGAKAFEYLGKYFKS